MADVKWPLLRVEYTEADDLVEAERPDAAFAVLTKHDDVDTAHCQVCYPHSILLLLHMCYVYARFNQYGR